MQDIIHQLRSKLSFGIIIFTIFLDYLSVMMFDPIITQITTDSSIIHRDNYRFLMISAGLLFGIYSIAQFFAAPILGGLSQKYGRKPILAFSLFGTIVSRILMIVGLITSNLWIILFSRFLDGATGGNISVAESAISDISTEENRGKNFRTAASAMALGLALGPVFNIISYFSVAKIIPGFDNSVLIAFTALSLAVINFILFLLFFTETLFKKHISYQFKFSSLNIFAQINKLKSKRKLFLIISLFTFGFWLMSYLKIYIPFKLQQSSSGELNEAYINIAYLYVGFWLIISQQYILKKYIIESKETLMKFMTICLVGVVILLAFSLPLDFGNYYYVVALILSSGAALFAIGYGAVYPIFNAYLCDNSEGVEYNLNQKESIGNILGINTSINAFFQGFAPVLGGLLALNFIELPIFLGLVLILSALFIIKFR